MKFIHLGIALTIGFALLAFPNTAEASGLSFTSNTTTAFTAGNCTIQSGSTGDSVTMNGNTLTYVGDVGDSFTIQCGSGMSLIIDNEQGSGITQQTCDGTTGTYLQEPKTNNLTTTFVASATSCVPLSSRASRASDGGSSPSGEGSSPSGGESSPSRPAPATATPTPSTTESTQSEDTGTIQSTKPDLRERLLKLKEKTPRRATRVAPQKKALERKATDNFKNALILQKRQALMNAKSQRQIATTKTQTGRILSIPSTPITPPRPVDGVFKLRRQLLEKKKESSKGTTSSTSEKSLVIPTKLSEALERLRDRKNAQ